MSALPSQIWFKLDEIFSSDSCLMGCGALSQTHFLHFEIPANLIKARKYVNQFEMYAVMIAIRMWKEKFQNKNIQIYCENSSTVDILKSGKASCPFMQCCLREIKFHSAKFNFRVCAVHLRGCHNRLNDALSRWQLDPQYQKKLNIESELNLLSQTLI